MKMITTAIAVAGTVMFSGLALAGQSPGVAVTFEAQEAIQRYDVLQTGPSAASELSSQNKQARKTTKKNARTPSAQKQKSGFDHDSYPHGGGQ